jgi:hypothetical protein
MTSPTATVAIATETKGRRLRIDLVGGQDSEFGEAILARLERLTNPPA